uniref:Uncharacterized protein n=1 Tax=Zea mays TaxID=4577 RepID=A0A804NSB9_MAIZE
MASLRKGLNAAREFFQRWDEWRRHPMVGNQLRHDAPGLDIAIVAFRIYLVDEPAYNRLYRPPATTTTRSPVRICDSKVSPHPCMSPCLPDKMSLFGLAWI